MERRKSEEDPLCDYQEPRNTCHSMFTQFLNQCSFIVLTITVIMYSQVVKKDYNDKGAVVGPHLPVEFEASKISLELPSKGVTLQEGWRLLPLFNPEVNNYVQCWSELVITNACSCTDY